MKNPVRHVVSPVWHALIYSSKRSRPLRPGPPDLMIRGSSSDFNPELIFSLILFLVCSPLRFLLIEVSIQQTQSQHNIDHHENIHIGIVEEFGVIYLV